MSHRSRALRLIASLGILALLFPAGAQGQGTESETLSPADLDRWEAANEALGELIQASGALGSFFDEVDGIVVVVPSSGSSSFTVGAAARLGLDVRVEQLELEPEQVAEVMAAIRDPVWQRGAPGYVTSSWFDPRAGAVRVRSNAPSESVRTLLDRYPARLIIEFEETTDYRHADVEPHWGGAKMVSPQDPGFYCSSGFSVNNVNGNPRTVSAGHCFLLNWTVNAFEQPPGTTFGTVKQRDNYPANDLVLIGGGGVDYEAAIYRDNHLHAWVDSAGYASGAYDLYCKSGAGTGEDCGFDLIASGVQVCRTDRFGVYGCKTNLQRFEPAEGVQNACYGDSGAPFYRYVGTVFSSEVKIVGMVSGGDAGCATHVDIEPWSDISSQYSLTIMAH